MLSTICKVSNWYGSHAIARLVTPNYSRRTSDARLLTLDYWRRTAGEFAVCITAYDCKVNSGTVPCSQQSAHTWLPVCSVTNLVHRLPPAATIVALVDGHMATFCRLSGANQALSVSTPTPLSVCLSCPYQPPLTMSSTWKSNWGKINWVAFELHPSMHDMRIVPTFVTQQERVSHS